MENEKTKNTFMADKNETLSNTNKDSANTGGSDTTMHNNLYQSATGSHNSNDKEPSTTTKEVLDRNQNTKPGNGTVP